MPLTMSKLKILGIMVQELEKDGSYRKGALYVSQKLDLQKEAIQAMMNEMLIEGYLERKETPPGAKYFPLRLTAKANGERNRLFHEMFSDIKSILLKKN